MILSKCIKFIDHYIRFPVDLLLLPVSILFGYFHGGIKLHAACTLHVVSRRPTSGPLAPHVRHFYSFADLPLVSLVLLNSPQWLTKWPLIRPLGAAAKAPTPMVAIVWYTLAKWSGTGPPTSELARTSLNKGSGPRTDFAVPTTIILTTDSALDLSIIFHSNLVCESVTCFGFDLESSAEHVFVLRFERVPRLLSYPSLR